MRKQRCDWETIRAKYKAGSNMGKLSNKYGVDKAAISRRAKKEAWAQDVTGAVDQAIDAKVSGIVNTVDPEKEAAAIASAADEKVAVIIRHREGWETQRELVTTAIEKSDFDKAKLAKITAETLKIRREAERKAWGIHDVDAQPDGGALTVRILRVSGEQGMEITLPHNWRPRDYQIPMWRYMEHGGRRSVLLWHRRAGKDDNSLRYLASTAMEKTATYWYLLPKAVQVRRAIQEAVNPHTGKRRVIGAFPDAIVARTRDNEMTLTLANDSSIHFLGADNFDTLVGSPPCGIVFSKYSLTNPLSWAYLKPILEESDGWAIFNFTSRERNHAATPYEYATGEESWFAQRLPVTETSMFTPEQVEEIRKEMHRTYGEEDGEALFRQECMYDLDAPVVGAYYDKLLTRAADEGRITGVPYSPAAPVFTAWDLGMGDSTAIWVAQCVSREIHLIDYYEANGQPLAHYADWVRGRGYGRPTHYLPHDTRTRGLDTGKNQEEVLAGLDIDPVLVVPQQSVAGGINAVRTVLPRCWFDRVKCGAGAEALRNYRKGYDEKRRVFHDHPLHDWTDHTADAFRYLALSCGQHQKSGSKGFRPRRR